MGAQTSELVSLDRLPLLLVRTMCLRSLNTCDKGDIAQNFGGLIGMV